MSIKIGHASADENRKASGGVAGDQTGGEVTTRPWYSSPWDVVLRPKRAEVAEKSSVACEAACANNNIGYDQGSRNTLYHYAKLKDFNLAEIKDKCECDCSSLMHVCAIAGGAKLSYGLNGYWTGNMVAALEASGEYEALRDPKYLASDAYLKRGDILVNTKSHTAMALENGAMAGENAAAPAVDKDINVPTTSAVMLTPLPLLKKGSKGSAVWAMQTLLTDRGYSTEGVDSDFGDNTEKALKRFQTAYGLEADGECGKMTWQKLICE